MHLEGVIAALAPADVLRRAPVEIADLAYDARDVRAGSLFFCVPGGRADGHDFAGEAVANGAVALVVERPLELGVPQLVVADARRPRRSTSSAPSARCSTRATEAARWRRPPTAPTSDASTACASPCSCSRT